MGWFNTAVERKGKGILLALLVGACASSGIVSSERIETSAEAQWSQILETVPQATDQATTQHVRVLAGELLVAAGEDPSEWQVALFDAPDSINAFALPNKRIGIFTGLLPHVANDDQLAAIIGHEIAHVRLNHTSERINNGFAPNILIGVAKLPGAVTDIGPLETAGSIAGGAVAAGTTLPFGRGQELEADREGLRYLAGAGYDPAQAAAFWEQMASSGARKNTIEVLSTHPSDARRVAALKKAVAELE